MARRYRLSESEQTAIVNRYGRRCLIDDAPIDSVEDLEFDALTSSAASSNTLVENLAPICRIHSRQKGAMALLEYRDYLQLAQFFADGMPKYLDDVIRVKGCVPGQPLPYVRTANTAGITLAFVEEPQTVPLYTCPATEWPYFYAVIPIQYVQNDLSLQPRPLRHPALWGLYRHFQSHSQLSPSLCRFDDRGRLLLFDGQHKAAAQIWAGRTAIECKVYLRPEASRIRETNLDAHQNYRQKKA